MKATEVIARLAESNVSLLPRLWRDSLHVTCGLTACTPGSAPGPTLGNEYGKTLPLPYVQYGDQQSSQELNMLDACIAESVKHQFVSVCLFSG